MRRRAGPVQQWVNSIPSPVKVDASVSPEQDNTFHPTEAISAITEPKDIPWNMSKTHGNPANVTLSAPVGIHSLSDIGTNRSPSSLPHHGRLSRDLSLQSDSSRCSSVESLLELRKADPEAVLLGLGFGGCSTSPQDNGPLSRIPKRFLQPSRLKGIAIGDFVKQQQESSESFDTVSLGYRGLTGSPYVAPSEIVQKIMERLREHESHEVDLSSTCDYSNQDGPPQQNGKLSVLSPDNRLFLEKPRSKSPDMRNKRMIIGHRSFAFGCDGDLIEIGPANIGKESENGFESYKISRKDRATPDESSKEDTDEKTGYCTSICSQDRNASSDSDSVVQCPYDASSINDRDDGALEDSIKWEGVRRFASEKERSRSKDLSPYRRKSLKRQSRVADIDEEYDSDSKEFVNKLLEDFERKSQFCEDGTCDTDTSEGCGATLAEPTRKNATNFQTEGALVTQRFGIANLLKSNANSQEVNKSDSHESVEAKFCNDKNQICCYDTTMTQSCKHDKSFEDCCCHVNGTKCWKKMDKILEENRKLEHMVVKNRKEMAEIRNILSNVLSVRMEPGF